MDGFGDEFFAGTALTLHQHGGEAGSYLRHEIEDPEHALALAYDVFEVVALFEGALELNVFFLCPAPANCGANIGQELLIVPGLLYKVGGAGLHGFDGFFYSAISGNHDYRELRVAFADFVQDFEAVHAWEREVQQDQIKGALGQTGETIFAAFAGLDGIAFHFKQSDQRFANSLLIVNDQNGTWRRRIKPRPLPRCHECCFCHLNPFDSFSKRAPLVESWSSWSEIPGKTWCPRRVRSRHESCQRAPG